LCCANEEGGNNRGWARERLVRFLVININRSLTEAFEGYAYIDQFDTIPTINKWFLKVVGRLPPPSSSPLSPSSSTFVVVVSCCG